MISGAEEEPKPISINVVDKAEKTEKIAATNEVVIEPNPPVELNVNDGDW